MRAVLALASALAFALAGCTQLEAPIETSSLTGSLDVGDGLRVENVHLTIAPDDAPAIGTPDAPASLKEAASTARTALARDHFVLALTLRERTPGSGAGVTLARLDWNGAPAGTIRLQSAGESDAARGIELRFDVGARIEASSVYLLGVERGGP